MQSELTLQFQLVVKQVFGGVLAPFGFSEGVDTPYGVEFSRFDLDISFSHECREPDLVELDCMIRWAGRCFGLKTIAEYLEVDWEQWNVPAFVTDPGKMGPAIEQLNIALLDLCGPILKGDLSILRRGMPRQVAKRARVRSVIQDLYVEAYGAWLDKDFAKLLALYAELERLGYTLNEVQRERASVARRSTSTG